MLLFCVSHHNKLNIFWYIKLWHLYYSWLNIWPIKNSSNPKWNQVDVCKQFILWKSLESKLFFLYIKCFITSTFKEAQLCLSFSVNSAANSSRAATVKSAPSCRRTDSSDSSSVTVSCDSDRSSSSFRISVSQSSDSFCIAVK